MAEKTLKCTCENVLFPLGKMVKVLLYFPPGEDIAVATTNHHPDILSPFAARDGLLASQFLFPPPLSNLSLRYLLR